MYLIYNINNNILVLLKNQTQGKKRNLEYSLIHSVTSHKYEVLINFNWKKMCYLYINRITIIIILIF